METLVSSELSDYEIERGKPMPSKQHGILQSRLNFAILKKYEKKIEVISELNLQIPNLKPFVPDLCIYPQKPVDWLRDEISVSEAPLTVIEILSPTQTVDEILEKFNQYFSGGVKSCWLVIPSLQSIYVILPNKQTEVYKAEILNDPSNGISIDLNEVFG